MREQRRKPLGPISDAASYADQLQLWDAEPEERRQILTAYFEERIEDHCKCGRQLTRLGAGGGMCPACLAALDSEDKNPNIEERMAAIGVPPAYRHCRLEEWQGPVPNAVLDWLIAPRSNLVIFGPDTGVGKTHLATATLYSLQAAGHRCWWTSAVELARRLSLEEFSPEQTAFHKSSRVEFLLVDDLGSEDKAVVNSGPRVRALLDERHRWNRHTIVTTNLTVDQLTQLDPRLASRLLAGSVVERQGEDFRWAR